RQVRSNVPQSGNHLRLVGAGLDKDNVTNCAGLPDLLGVAGRAPVSAIDIQPLSREPGTGERIRNVFRNRVGLLQLADLQLRSEHQAKPGTGQGKEGGEKNERSVIHDFAPALKRSAVAAA